MITTDLINGINADGVVMLIGAHSDDIEIGCGGTIRKLVAKNKNLTYYWIVLSANGLRQREAHSSASSILSGSKNSKVMIMNFRNGFFPFVASEIKEFFESLKELQAPDLIFTHFRDDRHQDHRTVSELTWNTFRSNLILEYEIPKYDGELGSPNVFVTLTNDELNAKQAHLYKHFTSQHNKQWFTHNTFKSLCRIRGIECNSPTGFAEAFHGRKILL